MVLSAGKEKRAARKEPSPKEWEQRAGEII
jgi:hypothetical protein